MGTATLYSWRVTTTRVTQLTTGRRLLIFWSIVTAVLLDWIPAAFVIPGVLALYNWDAARASRSTDRRWYRAWLAGLVLASLGLVYSVLTFGGLAAI